FRSSIPTECARSWRWKRVHGATVLSPKRFLPGKGNDREWGRPQATTAESSPDNVASASVKRRGRFGPQPRDQRKGVTFVKLSKARLEPIPETQWSDKVKQTLREIKVGQGEVPDIFKTL